jgi:DNA-binding MarR family transcriptional regulator
MAVSAADGRQRDVSLTLADRSKLEQAHRWQEQFFDELTEGWSEKRRRDFQQAMADLIDESYALGA